MLRTTVRGETCLYQMLWRVVQRQIGHAAERPKEPFDDHRLVIMVFAFHTLEAYLNFVGERLAPELWDNERTEKSIRSFPGKMRKVLEICNIADPDRNGRPYSTVWKLKNLRDMVSHGKIEKFREIVDYTADGTLQRYETPLDQILTPENARVAHDDILEFIGIIHSAALLLPLARQLVGEHRFPETAFDGVLRRTSRRPASPQ
jgi:hypothetical protein